MSHTLFSVTPFALKQAISQHLPNGFASGPVLQAVERAVNDLTTDLKPALTHRFCTVLDTNSKAVEVQYERSLEGEIGSLRVLADGFNVTLSLPISVIQKVDKKCLDHFDTLANIDLDFDDDGECPNCAGTGEGQFEGSRCGCCRGKGSR